MARFIKVVFTEMKLEDLVDEAPGNQRCALQKNTQPCSCVLSAVCLWFWAGVCVGAEAGA